MLSLQVQAASLLQDAEGSPAADLHDLSPRAAHVLQQLTTFPPGHKSKERVWL